MAKMVAFFLFFSLLLLGLTDAGQEYQLLPLLNTISHRTNLPVALSVSEADLPTISSSVLLAETWLKTHVLTHFPSANISTIVVGNTLHCHKNKWALVLPTVKNLYHSLLRWGLDQEIKVSVALSKDCINSHLTSENFKSLLNFLQNTNNMYSVIAPPHFSPSKAFNLVAAHTDFVNNLGFSELPHINILIPSKQMNKKLSFSISKPVEPYPARPTPLPPLRSVIGVTNPISPSLQIVPPENSFSAPPMDIDPPIDVAPASPPSDMTGPPCVVVGPAPDIGEEKPLWCVAKPTVPADTLHEAMDYACGDGGGDCEEIMPHGRCYTPNTMVAHASYAFNSYWQKNKNNGGSCSFGGTAMIINSDPSFLHCQFILL